MKSIDHHRLFESLDPPEGGRTRFANELAQGAQGSKLSWVATGMAAALVVLTISLISQQTTPTPEIDFESSPALARLLGEEIEPNPSVSVQLNTETAEVTRQESQRPNIRIYAIVPTTKSNDESS